MTQFDKALEELKELEDRFQNFETDDEETDRYCELCVQIAGDIVRRYEQQAKAIEVMVETVKKYADVTRWTEGDFDLGSGALPSEYLAVFETDMVERKDSHLRRYKAGYEDAEEALDRVQKILNGEEPECF